MKVNKRISPNNLLLFILFVAIISLSCNKEGQSEILGSDPKPYSRNDRSAAGEIQFNDEKVIVIIQDFGTVFIGGTGNPDAVRWFMDKWAWAQTQQEADANVSKTYIDATSSADSLFITIKSLPTPQSVSVSTGLSLTIPYHKKCIVKRALGDVYADGLGDSIYISNVRNIDITRSNNSCFITNASGTVSVETAFPPGGKCTVTDTQGNISIKVPKDISAALFAKVTTGTISHSNLTITSLSQTNKQLTGILGSGNGEIRLESNSGNISLAGLN